MDYHKTLTAFMQNVISLIILNMRQNGTGVAVVRSLILEFRRTQFFTRFVLNDHGSIFADNQSKFFCALEISTVTCNESHFVSQVVI